MEFDISTFWLLYIVSGLVGSGLLLIRSKAPKWKLTLALVLTTVPVFNVMLCVIGVTTTYLRMTGRLPPNSHK